MSNKLDLELILAAGKGDERAFEAICKEFGSKIFTGTNRILGEFRDAEDATQETFLKAWVKLREGNAFGTVEHFEKWLFLTARNQAYDLCRKRGREPIAFVDESQLQQRRVKLSEEVIDSELEGAVNECFGALEPEDQRILGLFSIGTPQTEIARMCGRSDPTVMRHKNQAIRRISDCLKDKGVLPRQDEECATRLSGNGIFGICPIVTSENLTGGLPSSTSDNAANIMEEQANE